ncbi:MAG: hypothetical protein IPM29_02485 [Planctomycetes bacterium]|nr:hypothetical protein [Planctomycetota bacterium]
MPSTSGVVLPVPPPPALSGVDVAAQLVAIDPSGVLLVSNGAWLRVDGR